MNSKKLLIISIMLLFNSYSHAYIDPGTGSIIIQVLIASFVGIAYTAKIFWKQITGFIKKIITSIKKTK